MFEYWHSGWHMWWMAGSWVVGLVVALLFVWALVNGTAFKPSGHQESPETILKRRFARGEINTDEYHQRLVELRK